MPDATPNYLNTQPDGTVSAVFPGGVEIQADTTLNNPTKSVQWEQTTPGGPLVARISAAHTAIVDQLQLTTNSSGGQFSKITMQSSPSAFESTAIIQTGGPGGTPQRTILDSAGNSSFAQWAPGSQGSPTGPQKTKLAVGSTVIAVALGWSTYAFNWGFTWTTILGFNYSIGISVGASITSSELLGFNTTQGIVDINSAAAQNVAIYWTAWGT